MPGSNSIRGDQSIIFADNLSFDGTQRQGALDTDGQLFIGATASDRANNGGHVRVGSITSPMGSITIGYSAPNITIEAGGGGGFTWVDVTGTSDDLEAGMGYISNNAGLVTLTLPATCSVGEMTRVAGFGSGLWSIAQNAGQTIHYGLSDTTTGATGSLTATNRYDAIELLCVVEDTDFVVLSSIGNITVA